MGYRDLSDAEILRWLTRLDEGIQIRLRLIARLSKELTARAADTMELPKHWR
jgi:hypothetical protein